MNQTFDIFIDQLVEDEDLRHAFIRGPRKNLGMADQWALPLSDNEISALIAMEPALWERVAEEFIDRLQAA